MKLRLNQTATEAYAFLTQNRATRILQFVGAGTFPKNACEGSAFLLKYLLELKHEISDVAVVKGTSKKFENHYWVETHGLIYDLTAHQFPKIDVPIIGEIESPLRNKFCQVELVSATPDFDKSDVKLIVSNGGL